MGGDCLNTGCVPSKALLRTARFMGDIKRSKELGINQAQATVDWRQVQERIRSVIRGIAPHDSVERYTDLGVSCFKGQADILDSHHVRVGDKVLRGKTIVLALGADPIVPSIPGLSESPYVTSENLWDMPDLPKRLIVLGAGPIGCEMTQAFNLLGCHVTLVDQASRILPREDDDVAEEVQGHFVREGVNFRMGFKAAKVERIGDSWHLHSSGGDKIPFDRMIVAVGRRPRTSGIDWQKLGITLNQDGTIKVDSHLCTNGKNIFASGDVIGPYQFTHVASHQAWYAAVNGMFSPFKRFAADYSAIPWTTFTHPEVATVGLTETAAKARSIPYEVTRYGIDDLDRAICDGDAHGFVKVLTVPGKDRILGATIVSSYAGEMITEFVSAMRWKRGLNSILSTIHCYPTWSEANKYVAGAWKKAHAPQGILHWLSRFHAWRRG